MSQHSKPFNLAHATQGAPVQLNTGAKARLVCFDRKWITPVSCISAPLLALVDDMASGESLRTVAQDGKVMGYDQHIVMAPLGMVEGKPVFVGDVLECPHYSGGPFGLLPVEPWSKIPEGNSYRWPKPKMVHVYRKKLQPTEYEWAREGTPKQDAFNTSPYWTLIQSFEEPK